MHARASFVISSINTDKPHDAFALGREKLADIMTTIAVFAEALNYAHFNLLGSADLDWQTSIAWGPSALVEVTDKRHPEAGMYDRWFHFLNGRDGTEVSVNWHDPKFAVNEAAFSIDVMQDGSFEIYSRDAAYRSIRLRETRSPDEALAAFGAWMKRNFEPERLAQVEAWVPKIIEGKMSMMPMPRTNWVGPFAAERRLTAS